MSTVAGGTARAAFRAAVGGEHGGGIGRARRRGGMIAAVTRRRRVILGSLVGLGLAASLLLRCEVVWTTGDGVDSRGVYSIGVYEGSIVGSGDWGEILVPRSPNGGGAPYLPHDARPPGVSVKWLARKADFRLVPGYRRHRDDRYSHRGGSWEFQIPLFTLAVIAGVVLLVLRWTRDPVRRSPCPVCGTVSAGRGLCPQCGTPRTVRDRRGAG